MREEFHVLRQACCLCARPSEERRTRKRGALDAVKVPEFPISDFRVVQFYSRLKSSHGIARAITFVKT